MADSGDAAGLEVTPVYESDGGKGWLRGEIMVSTTTSMEAGDEHFN